MDDDELLAGDVTTARRRRRRSGRTLAALRWLALATAALHLLSAGPLPASADLAGQDDDYTLAYVNLTFTDTSGRRLHSEKEEVGKYGQGKIDVASGLVVHLRNKNGTSNFACETPFDNEIPRQPWIALIRRGSCSYTRKIANAAQYNATAVVIYDDKTGPTQKMPHRDCDDANDLEHDNPTYDAIRSPALHGATSNSGEVPNFVSILIPKEKGERIAEMAENGTLNVYMYITVGTHQSVRYTNINRTSVLFVSISFIVLMIISLAWLIFYYVQRFRYINAKDQLARRLCGAAKKALAKIPVKTIKETDYESECCAVCIEPYKVSDVLRILPCKHQFHKTCVDPWLLDHRTCPMCKMDILKFYGLVFTGSQESILQIEIDDGMMHANPHGDHHDPGGRGSSQHSHLQAAAGHGGLSRETSSRSVCGSASATHPATSGSNAAQRRSSSRQDVAHAGDPSSTFQTNSIDSIKIAILENSPMASARMLLNRHSAYRVSLPPEKPAENSAVAAAVASAPSIARGTDSSSSSGENTPHQQLECASLHLARETKDPQEVTNTSTTNTTTTTTKDQSSSTDDSPTPEST